MRNPINKRIPRLFISEPARYLPLFILMIVAIIPLSSFFMAQGSIEKIYYDHLKNGKVEDGQFTTVQEISKDTWKKLENEGIKLYENFYVELEDGSANLNIYKKREKINLANVIEGRLPENRDEIALDNNYTISNNYILGDKIKLANKEFKLVGKIVLPDYISMMKSNNDLLMDTLNFGVGLVGKDDFEDLADKGINYNYAYRELEKSKNKKEANDKLKDLTKIIYEDNVLTEAMTKDQNKRIAYLIDDMGGDVPMMQGLLVLIMISIAFIFTMQTKNLIESESSVIGTLMASGYSRFELIVHYALLPLMSVLLAAIIGNIATYTVFSELYVGVYYSSFSLPTFTPIFNARAFLMTTLIPGAVIFIIVVSMLINKLKISPLRFLRNDLTKKKGLSKMSFKRLGFIGRFRIKVLLANKLNIVVLLFGVSIASILFCFGLGLKPIIDNHSKNLMKEMPSKYQTYVRGDTSEIDEEKFAASSFEINIDGKNHPFMLYGISKDSKYFENEELSKLNGNEVYASEGLLEKFGLKRGDQIEVTNPYTGETKKLTIKSKREGNVSLNAFMNIKDFNKLMGYDENYFSGYFSDKRLDLEEKNVLSIIDREVIGKAIDHFVEMFGSVRVPIVVASIIFYFIIIYLLSKTIVEKSKKEISYLKIFGFTDSESTNIYLQGTGVFLFIYMLLLPFILKKFMIFFMRESMKKFDAYLEPYLPKYVYIMVILTGIVIFAFVQYLQMRKISKLSMVEALKDVTG